MCVENKIIKKNIKNMCVLCRVFDENVYISVSDLVKYLLGVNLVFRSQLSNFLKNDNL